MLERRIVHTLIALLFAVGCGGDDDGGKEQTRDDAGSSDASTPVADASGNQDDLDGSYASDAASTDRGDASDSDAATHDGAIADDGGAVDAGPPVTYLMDVKPIFDRYCVACHAPGGEGPFSLTDYKSAYSYGSAAYSAARARIMPPCGSDDSCSVSESDLELMRRWIQQGRPEGE